MDDFLHDYGLAEAYGATWVLVPNRESTEVIGYFTLRPDPTNPEDESDASVVVLERLAVRSDLQGQKYGRYLVVDVIKKVLATANLERFAALELYAIDANAKSFYLGLDFGFEEIEPGGSYLAIPMGTLTQLDIPRSAPPF
jgi:GNAT superfamily N-acetyltransferase